MAMIFTGDVLHDKCFTFNGKSSADFRLVVCGGGTYNAPARSYETVQIPGRNGSLLLDNGYYEDVEVKYSVGFMENDPGTPLDNRPLESRLAEIRNWLMSPLGYCRLEDTYHPDEYRMAYISSDFDPDMLQGLDGGSVDIVFTCKPQRFLKEGEESITLNTTSDTVYNLTEVNALPLFNITTTEVASEDDTVTVGIVSEDGYYSQSITYNVGKSGIATGSTGNVTIDCEIMDAYEPSSLTSLNKYMAFNTGNESKIVLSPGKSIIQCTNVSAISVVPRWWRL